MKKTLSIILSLVMLLNITTWLDLTAYADTTISGDYEYKLLDDGTAKINYYTGYASDVVIPSVIDGYIVTALGYTFEENTSVKNVSIPDTITSIAKNTFSGCNNLNNIYVDENNEYYSAQDGVLFNKDKTELIKHPAGNTRNSYTINSSVSDLSPNAFIDCKNLTEITIPNSVTSIGDSAFENCASLTNITIPNSIDSIKNFTFFKCINLTNITIPNSIKSIGSYAFSDCEKLANIEIPTSVTNIGPFAFSSCKSLTKVTIPYSVTLMRDTSFLNCLGLTDIVVDSNNEEYSSQNGVLFDKNKTYLIQYPSANTRKSYTIPSSVTSMYEGAFSKCNNLENINIDDNEVYSSQDGVLFNKDKTRLILYPTGNTRKSYTVPNSVKYIYDNSFSYCSNITNVTITNNVTEIGYAAFEECNNLKNVYYKGSQSDWEKISITFNNDCLLNATIHYNYIEPCKIHNYKNTVAKATTKSNGKIVKKCSVCGETSTTIIYYPKTISLSATIYTYNGKVKKPSVILKDSNGEKISASNYTVSHSSGCRNVGKYTITVNFKGNYSGTVKRTFTIKPKSTSISKLTAGKKKFIVKWKKQSTQTTGYQIQYSTSSKFKTAKTVTVSKNKTTGKTISDLKAKKKYYVRVRTYKTVKVNGKSTKIYSYWSKAKTVTTQK